MYAQNTPMLPSPSIQIDCNQCGLSAKTSTPAPQFTLWMGIVLAILTVVGALWASASQWGSLRTMVEEDHAVIMRIAVTEEKNAATLNGFARELGTMQGNLAGRTAALETKADRNWTAIRRQGTQSEKNRSDISRQDSRQNAQSNQQSMDRVAAVQADQRQSARADQSDTRQDAAATSAATSERVLSNRQDQDRQVNASEARLQTAGQDRLRAQQDIDRAATPKSKGK
jgi:hypothetical protein